MEGYGEPCDVTSLSLSLIYKNPSLRARRRRFAGVEGVPCVFQGLLNHPHATIYHDPGATLEDLREAVTTLEETERTARRVLGGAHPTAKQIENSLQNARAALHARETPPSSA